MASKANLIQPPVLALPEIGVRPTRLAPLLLLAMTITSATAMRTVFSSVQESAKLELGLSDISLSLIQGVAVAIPIAILSIPIGRMVDRTNRMRLLAAMAAVWTFGMFLTVFAHSFPILFLARMLAGLGSLCALPVAISIAADLSSPATRGRSMMLLSLGNYIGMASAFGFGGALFGALAQGAMPSLFGLEPWRGVHLLFAIGSALLILPLLLSREPERHELGKAAGAPLGEALAQLWAMRGLLIPLFIGQVTVVMADTAAAIWAAPVLGRDYGLRPEDFGGWLGLTVLLGGIGGALLGGFGADLGHKSRFNNGILIGAVIAATLSIPGAFFPLMPGVTGFGLMLGLLLLCGAATGLITATALAVLVPNEIRGICLGAFVVVGGVIGFGVAPTLVTLISDLLGGEAYIRYGLAATTAVTSLIAAIGFAAAMRRPAHVL